MKALLATMALVMAASVSFADEHATAPAAPAATQEATAQTQDQTQAPAKAKKVGMAKKHNKHKKGDKKAE